MDNGYLPRLPVEKQENLIRFIVDEVYSCFNIKFNEHSKKTKKIEYIVPKQISIYLIKHNIPCLSNYDIANYFSLKSHASTIHAVKKIKGYISYDKKIVAIVSKLQTQVEMFSKSIEQNKEVQNAMFLKIALQLNGHNIEEKVCLKVLEIYNCINIGVDKK